MKSTGTTNRLRCIVCDEEARIRGLCRCCYQSAWNLVSTGETTWGELVKRGMALQAGARGRQKSKFRETLDRILASPAR